jgi:hypothetical protein
LDAARLVSYTLAIAPGDYIADGCVDVANYIVGRDMLVSTTDLRADGSGKGVTDAADFTVWRSLFRTIYAKGLCSWRSCGTTTVGYAVDHCARCVRIC